MTQISRAVWQLNIVLMTMKIAWIEVERKTLRGWGCRVEIKDACLRMLCRVVMGKRPWAGK